MTLTTSLAAGTHTLKVWWDSTAGSDQFLNLDNLTVTPGGLPPAGVTVDLGYADGATGLTPWQGSSNTIFIGEPPQCCLTHGPDNGEAGYDGGAIEVTNGSASPVTVNAVSADFGGGSSPSHFDLWGAGGFGELPQTLPSGDHLVMAMTSSFNFDTSDLFGEACHVDSGVVPVVHITMNGVLTDYQDDHQILNSDGADLASCPGDVSEAKTFVAMSPNAQAAAAPVNDVAPSLTGAAIQGRVLSGLPGRLECEPAADPGVAVDALRLYWSQLRRHRRRDHRNVPSDVGRRRHDVAIPGHGVERIRDVDQGVERERGDPVGSCHRTTG